MQNVPSHSPYPEFPCWLLSPEGGGRYLNDLQMKRSEGEWIQTNMTQQLAIVNK